MIWGSCHEEKQQQQRSLLSFVEILRKQQGWVVGAVEVPPQQRTNGLFAARAEEGGGALPGLPYAEGCG